LAKKIEYTNTKITRKNKINIIIIPELIILLTNTVRHVQFSVNVIVFRWILTSSNGLMNSISEQIQIIKKKLINNNNK
jgi:ubiquitin C-terminal hydrolase